MPWIYQSNLLRKFRTRTGRHRRWKTPLSLREKWIVAAVAAQLLIAAWAIGGIPLRTQYVLSVFSIAGFLMLFVRFMDNSTRPALNLKRLLRFPVFWLGLALMLYMGIQAYNTAWVFVTDGRVWWLQGLRHITWLPSGMDTPIDGLKIGGMNVYRMMMLYGTPWLLTCTVWVGLRRRKSILIILWVLTVSYALWSILGLMQLAAGARRILWLYTPPSDTRPFSTIIYANHAAAYINIGLVLLLTLFLFYFNRSKRSMAHSGPHVFLISIVPLIITALICTYSSAGMFIGAVILLLFAIVYLIQVYLLRSFIGNPIPLVILIVMIAGLGVVLLQVIDQKHLLLEFESLQRNFESGLKDELRVPLYEATTEMVKDKWIYGWGAGSYRFYFPVYQRLYLELSRLIGGKPMFFRYAHNDFLQIPAELGAVGSCFIVLTAIYTLFKWLSLGRFMGIPLFMLMGGCVLVIAHASVDFILYNPAVLTTLCALICVGIKYQLLTRERNDT